MKDNTNYELPIDSNWTDEDGSHDGGTSTGVGYTIAWQRGSLNESGRNGAFVIEVAQSVILQLEYFNSGKFVCDENKVAIILIQEAVDILKTRNNRCRSENKLGTCEV